MNREYIGDGVYVEINTAGQIVLETGETDDRDNFCVSNQIYLEPEVYAALVDYAVRAMASTLPARSRR